MAKSTLYRMDDFLLKGAVYVGLAAGLVVSCWLAVTSEAGQGRSAFTTLWMTLLCAAPVVMAIVGYQIRKAERRALALLKIIDTQVEFLARDLMRGSDWTRESLERAIADLNNAGLAFIVWDHSSGKVQNGALRRETAVIDECGACGAKVTIEVSFAESAVLHCPYCHSPMDSALIAEEKARLFDELEVDRPSPGQTAATGTVGSGGGAFSIPTFFILAAVFWPAAVVYAYRHRAIVLNQS